MEYFFQAVALAVIGALLVVVLRPQGAHFGMLLAIACGCCIFFFAARLLEPVLDLTDQLRRMANLDMTAVTVLLKTAGVGIVTEVAVSVCEDAGQASLGRLVKLCGNGAVLYLTIPLLEEVLTLIQEILQG